MTMLDAYKQREAEAAKRLYLHMVALGLTIDTVCEVIVAHYHRDKPLTEQPRFEIRPLASWPKD